MGIVFEWIWNVDDYNFDKGYPFIVKYVEENGNTLVPFKYIFNDKTKNGYKLGIWIACQRRAKGNNLKIENIQKLEFLNGWTW